jgi:hypothetical protein
LSINTFQNQYILMHKTFTNIFWQRIAQRYRYLIRNTNFSQFIFSIHIEKPLSDGGLEIEAFEPQEIQRLLLELQNEGLIQLISDGQFRLTLKGIEYCKKLPETFG